MPSTDHPAGFYGWTLKKLPGLIPYPKKLHPYTKME
jgi:hypothetical protein